MSVSGLALIYPEKSALKHLALYSYLPIFMNEVISDVNKETCDMIYISKSGVHCLPNGNTLFKCK